ncbi:telomere length regulation protein elg1 [Trichoderma asperellum]|uniref:Telomere length regulation protein elg1 n=1 Tax=Trichoderma asperellum TaxID=101201 RepID=A0A6V8R2D1_TRIAP|nr:telomere length regulation protein elg1 [Trichoderma asperellum]
MGPVLVATMVQGENGDPSSKKLHPFFTKSDPDQPAAQPAISPLESTQPVPDDPLPTTADGPTRKRQRTDTSTVHDDPEAKKSRRGKKSAKQTLSGAILSHLNKPDKSDAHGSDVPVTQLAQSLALSTVSEMQVPGQHPNETTGLTADNSISSNPSADPLRQQTPVPAQQKKVLKFNPKTGTLGSPPKPKAINKPSRVITIKYGRDDEHRKALGDKIVAIFEGRLQISPVSSKKQGTKPKSQQVDGAADKSKTTHPFFTGKTKPQPNMAGIQKSLPKDDNSFSPAPAELRLPQRHFESGRKLQRRMRSQLRSNFANHHLPDEVDLDIDELAGQKPPKIHPAISRLYNSLCTQLSAFDKSQCESSSWIQKYAPTTAGQVLQPGREALLLSDWLHALRVESVESGSSEGDKGKGKPKKKRKKNKLDGFVIDSESEEAEMDEISDNEGDWAVLPSSALIKKSVMRTVNPTSKGSNRLKNAIILSGPHGSGKTAAVYAAAKELDFEIFELNSGSRRSGKDILEKVGDMTRNHLVQHNRAEPTAIDPEEVANDINSGKQGMMTSFFKPKMNAQPTKPGAKQPKQDVEKETKAPSKSQKQSLILLEEVDVLFEEDKQFWATLTSLIAQSKRPFIMTCNNESLVPIDTLDLHGIFRFSPAPPGPAVDLCLLIAANEGHALQRSAVEALYNSRNNDLRATITELNYWCQIGVGDRKGGFDWFYLRWPKGSDLDENGDVVRVISEDTYYKGMGWVNRDPIIGSRGLAAEEEAIDQAWDFWGFDMGDWCNSTNMNSWSAATMKPEKNLTTLGMLEAYDDFCSAMSCADLCSGGAYGIKLQEQLDPTLPDLPSRIKEDYIIGQALLEANPVVHYAAPNKAMSISIMSLARAALRKSTTEELDGAAPKAPILKPVDEEQAICIIDSSFRYYPHQTTRMDIAIAFDPIAIAPKAIPTTYLDPSVFDRTMQLIVLDVAPWIRGIVAYEHQLMQRRLKLSNLLSEGGGKRKRMRTTRSAYSALEGGERRTTRRERHFGDCLSTLHVMRTGGEKWMDLIVEEVAKSEAGDSTAASSPVSDDLALQQ